jgi:hypothetical protein
MRFASIGSLLLAVLLGMLLDAICLRPLPTRAQATTDDIPIEVHEVVLSGSPTAGSLLAGRHIVGFSCVAESKGSRCFLASTR